MGAACKAAVIAKMRENNYLAVLSHASWFSEPRVSPSVFHQPPTSSSTCLAYSETTRSQRPDLTPSTWAPQQTSLTWLALSSSHMRKQHAHHLQLYPNTSAASTAHTNTLSSHHPQYRLHQVQYSHLRSIRRSRYPQTSSSRRSSQYYCFVWGLSSAART